MVCNTFDGKTINRHHDIHVEPDLLGRHPKKSLNHLRIYKIIEFRAIIFLLVIKRIKCVELNV